MIAARVVALAALVGGFAVAPGATCAARAAGTVGIVIESSRAAEHCVQVEGEDVAALDALRATGVELALQDYGAGAVTICRIDGVGCDHPTQPCFCSCLDASGPCTFWGIYTLDANGGWTFAQTGIGEIRLRAGDVLGLRWSEQTEDGSAPPTGADPAGVCSRGEPVALSTPSAPERDKPWGLLILATVATMVILSALRPARGGRGGRGAPGGAGQ
jgi:hypothetical protein